MARVTTGFQIKERFETEDLAGALLVKLSHRQIDEIKRIAKEQKRTVTYMVRAAIEAMITADQAERGPDKS